MTDDDDLDRELAAARPHTAADDDWATSPAGDRAFAGIRRATTGPAARMRRWPTGRPLALGAGFAAAAAAVVAVALATSGSPPHQTPAAPNPSPRQLPSGTGPTPQHLELVSYDTCDSMLQGLRSHTAKIVTAYGLPGSSISYALGGPGLDAQRGVSKPAASSASVPDHSTTNVQEAGVGEPDTVETDGRRVVSVSGGVLRVVDAATHTVTGRLDLTMYAGANSAQLLLSGDRVLVILGDAVPYDGGRLYDQLQPTQASTSSFLLVDLTNAPTIVSTLHPNGGYVDARMVDGTVRLVVRSTPRLFFPAQPGKRSSWQRITDNREIVAHTPLSSWLPNYDVTTGVTTRSHTVPCTRVSHPQSYTGASMLTVYTVDLAASFADPQPVTLAADGTSVYASTTSLYISSAAAGISSAAVGKTHLHRFDISTAGRPAYLGSATVPGQLFDSYSMSEYASSLRVVTTTYSTRTSTAVYVLDARTLRITGHVGGLGVNEQLHGVRFLGPLAYVVTFRSVDPLYVLDLHDPGAPRLAGELTITGYSDYLHPVADGRLLGIGENVNSAGIVSGLQVSLFDVDSAAHPVRLDRITRAHSPSETPIDPHAFLYWPAAKLAVVPIDSWNADQSGAALVVHVGSNDLTTVGTIRNPAASNADGYGQGIQRTLVIGDDIWTMSSSGLQVSDLHSLHRRAWVPFT